MTRKEFCEFHKYLAMLIYEYNQALLSYSITDEHKKEIRTILKSLEMIMKICIIGGKDKMILKKQWKIIFSMIILLIDVIFYINSNTLGILAQNSKFYLIMTLLGWTWLLFFSSVLLYCIWDNEK